MHFPKCGTDIIYKKSWVFVCGSAAGPSLSTATATGPICSSNFFTSWSTINIKSGARNYESRNNRRYSSTSPTPHIKKTTILFSKMRDRHHLQNCQKNRPLKNTFTQHFISASTRLRRPSPTCPKKLNLPFPKILPPRLTAFPDHDVVAFHVELGRCRGDLPCKPVGPFFGFRLPGLRLLLNDGGIDRLRYEPLLEELGPHLLHVSVVRRAGAVQGSVQSGLASPFQDGIVREKKLRHVLAAEVVDLSC